MSERPRIDTNGLGCVLLGGGLAFAVVILAIGIAEAVDKCGWPW